MIIQSTSKVNVMADSRKITFENKGYRAFKFDGTDFYHVYSQGGAYLGRIILGGGRGPGTFKPYSDEMTCIALYRIAFLMRAINEHEFGFGIQPEID